MNARVRDWAAKVVTCPPVKASREPADITHWRKIVSYWDSLATQIDLAESEEQRLRDTVGTSCFEFIKDGKALKFTKAQMEQSFREAGDRGRDQANALRQRQHEFRELLSSQSPLSSKGLQAEREQWALARRIVELWLTQKSRVNMICAREALVGLGANEPNLEKLEEQAKAIGKRRNSRGPKLRAANVVGLAISVSADKIHRAPKTS